MKLKSSDPVIIPQRQVRMIALDLDGTLLKNDKRVSARTIRAIRAAQTAGIMPVYVTGRPLGGLPGELEKAFPEIRIAITSNGAVTTDMMTGKRLRERVVGRKAAEAVAKLCMERDVIHAVFMGGYGYCETRWFEMLLRHFKDTPVEAYVRKSRRSTDDVTAEIRNSRYGVENIWVMAGSQKERDEIDERIRRIYRLNTVLTAGTDVEAGHPEADKGLALTELAAELGISTEEIVSFGDNENDLGMMQAAGFSVAMGNGSETVKKAADYVTDSNEEDGVAVFIEKMLRR